jgi:hypothetical protein
VGDAEFGHDVGRDAWFRQHCQQIVFRPKPVLPHLTRFFGDLAYHVSQ